MLQRTELGAVVFEALERNRLAGVEPGRLVALAVQLEVAAATLQKYIRGERRLTGEGKVTAATLAHALGIEVRRITAARWYR